MYSLENSEGLQIFRFKSLKTYALRHGFTTRLGGISAKPYDSLNLSLSRPDAKENVRENFRLLCQAERLDENNLTIVNYAHGDGIELVTDADAGRGWKNGALPPCDALITRSKTAVLTTLHADCLSIFFYDPQLHVAGLAHAGWKGCIMEIGAKTVRRMEEAFGSVASELFVGIGPGICAKCFEVDKPVAQVFLDAYPEAVTWEEHTGKYHVDLKLVMRLQLGRSGVTHIEDMELCTACRRDVFFSHRRDKGLTGAMAAFIQLL